MRPLVEAKYTHAGYFLASEVENVSPVLNRRPGWREQVKELVQTVVDGDHVGVWEWFAETFPACDSLIPDWAVYFFAEGAMARFRELAIVA